MNKLTKEEILKVVQWCYSYCKDRVNYRDIKIELLENGLNENLADSVVWAYNNKKHSLTIKDLEFWDNEKGLYYPYDNDVLDYDILITKLINCPLRTHQKIEMWREACDMCGVNFTNNHCNGSWYSFEYTDENHVLYREPMSNIVEKLIERKWVTININMIERITHDLHRKHDISFHTYYNLYQNTFDIDVHFYDSCSNKEYLNVEMNEEQINKTFDKIKTLKEWREL